MRKDERKRKSYAVVGFIYFVVEHLYFKFHVTLMTPNKINQH